MEDHLVSNTMEFDLLDKKMRRLVCKLKKYNIDLEVFSHEDIEYGPMLGKGGEGIVRQCTITYNGLPVHAAAKTVLDNSDDAISITLDEIELLCLASDPIIATTQKVYGVTVVPEVNNPEMGHLVIITEAGIMNALQLYQEEQVPLHVTYELWAEMAAGVHTMHNKKIIHQDLKPENILITAINRNSDGEIEKINMKIIDLGMAKRVFNDKIVTDDIFGTNGYHPPEVLFEDTYDFRADIFMLGITFSVMLHSQEFLKNNCLKNLLEKLHAAKQKMKVGSALFEEVLEPSINKNHLLSDEIKNMLCSMLENQDSRDVTLLDIVELCHEQSDILKEKFDKLMPIRPSRNCQDSGFGSGGDNNGANHKGSSKTQKKGRRQSIESKGAMEAVSGRRVTRSNSTSSRRSISSVVSDFTDDRRVTRSQSVSSERSDITVMSDITDDRRIARANLKRLRSDTFIDEAVCNNKRTCRSSNQYNS